MYVSDSANPSTPEHFDLYTPPPPPPLRTGKEIIVYAGASLDDIARDCMARHGVIASKFYSLNKTAFVAHCRFEFMWRAYRVLAHRGSSGSNSGRRYTYQMIGRHFELRGRERRLDHTSVIHGIRKWDALRKEQLKHWIRSDNARIAASLQATDASHA